MSVPTRSFGVPVAAATSFSGKSAGKARSDPRRNSSRRLSLLTNLLFKDWNILETSRLVAPAGTKLPRQDMLKNEYLVLDSGPGLLSAGVTFFRRNDGARDEHRHSWPA